MVNTGFEILMAVLYSRHRVVWYILTKVSKNTLPPSSGS